MIMRIVIFLLLIASPILWSQSHNQQNEEHDLLHHKVFLKYGLVYVHAGHNEGEHESTGILIAAYGAGYSYRINHKWSLALEFSLESGNYFIHEDIQRENLFKIVAVGGYELIKHWGLFFGGGIEIEKHKNYAIARIGTEYVFPIGKDWAIAPILTFDHKVDYTSWEFSVGLSKSF